MLGCFLAFFQKRGYIERLACAKFVLITNH